MKKERNEQQKNERQAPLVPTLCVLALVVWSIMTMFSGSNNYKPESATKELQQVVTSDEVNEGDSKEVTEVVKPENEEIIETDVGTTSETAETATSETADAATSETDEVATSEIAEIATSEAVEAETSKTAEIATSETAEETESEVANAAQKEESTISGNSIAEIWISKDITMYEEADINSNIIATLKAGTKATNVTEAGGIWLKVTYESKEGYISYLYTDYAEKAHKKAILKTNFMSEKLVTITKYMVNMRDYPGTTTNVIDHERKGKIMEALALYELMGDDWWLLKNRENGMSGYIHGSFVDEGTEQSQKEETTKEDSVSVTETSSVSDNSVVTIQTTKNINLYEKADDSSNVIATVKKGTELNVTETGNGWLKGTYDGEDVYLYYLYTNYAEKAQKEAIEVERYEPSKVGIVTGRSVNLRSNPGITTKIIGSAKKQQKYEVLGLYHLLEGEEHGWYLIKTAQNKTVFIYGQYMQVQDEVYEKTVEVTVAKNYNQDNVIALNPEVIEPDQALQSEDDVTLMALAMTAEADACSIEEMARCGQVMRNRARINETDIRGILSAYKQYPVTWSKIQNGQVTATQEAKDLAAQILSGEKNGFEGSDAPAVLWNDGYYQGLEKQPSGSNWWWSGYHWYGTAY